MVHKNGGFPPIIYCNVNNKDSLNKERLFTTKIHNHTINIKNLLKENIQQPLIQVNSPDNEMIEVTEL
jgi:hypothetical protein